MASVSTAVVTGKPFAEILHEAIEWPAELIVLGAHRGGAKACSAAARPSG